MRLKSACVQFGSQRLVSRAFSRAAIPLTGTQVRQVEAAATLAKMSNLTPEQVLKLTETGW